LETVTEIAALRRRIGAWRSAAERVAFVPTMGNLHRGHLELVRRARDLADRVVVSIFVNPMQFGPGEDFESYPRTPEEDGYALQALGVELLFTPSVETLYPGGTQQTTRVEVPGVSEGLCGASRPGHFTGVATVVARLFNLVQPDVAVFGKKDYQQLAVVRKMVDDLCFPVEIEGVETVRENDGLAMSSRNRYLTPEQRRVAPGLYRVLQDTADAVRSGECDPRVLEEQALGALEKAGFRPDYVSIRQISDLGPARPQEPGWVILAAAWLGRARLIDNLEI
jgi:pantoate--beta-alanine ligase